MPSLQTPVADRVDMINTMGELVIARHTLVDKRRFSTRTVNMLHAVENRARWKHVHEMIVFRLTDGQKNYGVTVYIYI